ncbi:BTB domain containing protein [Pandoravirus salinus]|uniref:BTB domain containing protein n=1 Tax=Pandoravirus salinus TaxID=1349410 RepID=S4W0T5_9VIRU|nr:BTB domain [Pandoravirus salinus]AGO83982.1 BTB domain containing protein [Pandoravirus salinus]
MPAGAGAGETKERQNTPQWATTMNDDSDDGFDDAVHYHDVHQPATLGSLRRVYCDCAIQLRSSTSGSEPVRIEAHRAVLAGATYFAALFEHADPDRVEQKSPDGKRVLFAVYTIDVPFAADSLAFLVECMYAPHRLGGIDRCDDPVDVVQASLFLGMPAHYTEGLVEAALVRLFDCVAKGRGSDPLAQLGAFVRHLLGSDIDHKLKVALAERTVGVLAEADRDVIAAEHSDLMPAAYYRPETVVGGLVVDEDGHRWRALRIGVDNLDGTGGASTVAWQGLVFAAAIDFTNYDNDPSLVVTVSCAPEGEVLGAWPWGAKSPDGALDVEPRAVTIKVHAYHPTCGRARTTKTFGAWGVYKRPAQQDDTIERVLPKGASLAPFDFDGGPGTSDTRRFRTTRSAYLTKYESGTHAMRSLVACEVEIQVEETHS